MNNRERIFSTILKLLLIRYEKTKRLNLNNVIFTYDEFARAYSSMKFNHPLKKSTFNNFLQGHGSKKERCKYIKTGLACQSLNYYRLAAPKEGCEYELSSLLTTDVSCSLQSYNPEYIKSFLKKYFHWIVKIEQTNKQEQIPELTSHEAVWIAAATYAYNIYFHSNPNDIEKYYFSRSNITKLAYTYNHLNSVSSCDYAVKKSCVIGTGKYAYFSECTVGRRRLTFLRENDSAIPKINISGMVNTVNGMKSIRVIVDFIKHKYNSEYYPTDEEWALEKDDIIKQRAYVKIENVFVHRNPEAVLDYTVNHYCREPISLTNILGIYKRLLQSVNLSKVKMESLENINLFRNQLLNRKDLIGCGRDYYRKYNGNLRNPSKYIELLKLKKFDGFQVSTAYFCEKYPNLMKEMDIRNEDELFEYIKKYAGKYDATVKIKFLDPPELQIGDVNLEKQITDLMMKHAPISRNDLRTLYHQAYGSSKNVIDQQLRKIESYLFNNIYFKFAIKDNSSEKKISPNPESTSILKKIQEGKLSLTYPEQNSKILSELHYINDNTSYGVLYNRIMREFPLSGLVCEIQINDDEYQLLCTYARKKYRNKIAYRDGRAEVDVMFTVALIQIAVHHYDGSLWKYIRQTLGVQKLPANQQAWIGATATETLKRFGKVIFNYSENVTNILLHSFITDNFVNKYYEYLFQYYTKDMERSMSEDCEQEADFICDCIKNPFSKRQQFLSDYVGLSVIACRKYCKSIIAASLKLIDQTFWNLPIENVDLPDHLYQQFIVWKDFSAYFREQKSESEKKGGSFQKLYQKPHLECNLEEASFSIILPKQMLLMQDTSERTIVWEIITSDGVSTYPCNVIESYAGLKTKEKMIPIQQNKIFQEYCFQLVDNGKVVRIFKWKKSILNVFDQDGHWVEYDSLTEDEFYGYSLPKSKIRCDGIQDSFITGALRFYHFSFSEGELLYVPGDTTYYIGMFPEAGLSREHKLSGVVLRENEQEIPVYNKLPALIIDIEEERFDGTALWINGRINRLSQEKFIKVTYGRRAEIHYYYLDLSGISGMQKGINQITVDIPNTSRKIRALFAFFPEFNYQFEDGPYIYQSRGSLKTNCLIDQHGTINTEIKKECEPYNFDLEEMNSSKLICKVICNQMTSELIFDVPVFLYSWDNNNWSYTKPEDIWHTELKYIIYIRYPKSNLALVMNDGTGNKISYSFSKNASGEIICDLTRFKSYLSNSNQMIKQIKLLVEGKEIDFLKIIMKSFLRTVDLSMDYNTKKLTGRFDISGKSSYFADILCEDKILAAKVPIKDGKSLSVEIPIRTATYLVQVYELGFALDDFDDVEYSLIGSKAVDLINASELTGSIMLVKSINHVASGVLTAKYNMRDTYEHYIRIDEQLDSHTYTGTMILSFGKNNIIEVSEVKVYVPDLNNILQITVEFLQEGEYEAFLYDQYSSSVIQNENRTLPASERYRRYNPVLYAQGEEDLYVWNITYGKKDMKLEKKAAEWKRRGDQ